MEWEKLPVIRRGLSGSAAAQPGTRTDAMILEKVGNAHRHQVPLEGGQPVQEHVARRSVEDGMVVLRVMHGMTPDLFLPPAYVVAFLLARVCRGNGL